MASIIKDATNNMWVFTDTISQSSYNVVFDTINKFLDAKIKASLTVQSGAITPIFSNTNLSTYFDTGTEGSNSISIIPKATNTAGFIAVHEANSAVTGTPAYYTIKTGAGEANTANVVLYSTDGSNAGTNISGIVGTVTDTEPNSGYYLSFTGSGSSKIKTTGWMTAGTQLTAASKTRYFPITEAVTGGNGGDVVVYSTDGSNAGVNISNIVGTKATTEPTDGYYLAFTGSGSSKVTTAGYLPLNKITATGSSIKYFPITKAVTGGNGGDVVVYATDGSSAGVNISAIVGTKATSEPTSGYYLAFTGSGSSKVTTAGYLPLNEITTTGSSIKYFPITVASLAASSTNATATTTVAPGNVTISANTAAVSGKTRLELSPVTASSGIGTYYIAIKANAAANTTGTTSSISGTATATVASQGYAPTSLTGTGTVSGTATAKTSSKDSNVYYIPVPTATYDGNSASAEITKTTTDNSSTGGINVGAILGTRATAEPTSGYYISLQASGSGSSKITTAGWLPADQVLTAASTTAERFFPVTAAVLAVSKTGGSITPTVVLSKSSSLTWSTSDTSGVSVTGTGNGSVSNLSIKANVSTAGYIPTGDVATANSLTIAAASTPATEIKYITGVTIASGKSFAVTNSGTTTVTAGISGSTTQGVIKVTAYPSSGTTADAIQTIVNNGRWIETTISAANTWYYGKVKAGALTVTTSADTGNLSTYFNTGTSSDNNVTITPKYTNTAGFKTALTTATNNGGTSYWKIKTTSMTQNKVTTLQNNDTEINTRANASWGTGWISSGTIAPATFANSATANVTYVDISKTSAAPILISGDYLYINRGYVDNLKISLAKLVPDTLTDNKVFAPANYILTGYAAFDAGGAQISGTMQIYNGAYTVNVS